MSDYQPVIRYGHSTVRVGDYLYMWGGSQPDDLDLDLKLNPAQPSSQPQSFDNKFVLVYHLPTGKWEQKATTGKLPPGSTGYASAVIGKEILYFGGCCNHIDCFPRCFHNSLYGLNVDTLNWREVSPNTSQSGPMMKESAGMIAVQVDEEDYLVVFGGHGPSSENTPAQPSAQYSTEGFSIENMQCTNELHYYRILTGEWISPDIAGDRPPPITGFTLTSVNHSSAILFGGFSPSADYKVSDKLYVMVFNKEQLSLEISEVPKSSQNWPCARSAHSSVLINVGSIGPHLLVVGGFEISDCWLLDVTNKIWDEVSLPKLVADRYYHSLSVWNVTPNTSWVIEFGGHSALSTMSVIECTHTMISKWSFDVVPFNLYTNKLQEIILETADHFYLEDCSAEVQSQPQNNEKLQQLTEKQESQLKEVELQLEYLQKMVQKTQEELKASEQELKKLNLEEIKKKAMIELLQNSFQNQCNQQHDPSFRKQLASFFSFDQKKKRSGVKIEELVEKSMNKYLREYGLLMPEVKSCREVAVQCDYLIRQTDLFDSSVTIAGQKRFDLNENSSSFYWEEFGFKLQCPHGAVSEDTEVAVTAIVKGCFDLPRGTELVSAVYAISVSKALLKPLVIEIEHCVDLKNTSQTGCLKFVRAPLKPPNAYQFSIVEGGSFSVGNRYGSIERDEFCALGIAHVAEMSNGDTANGGGNGGGTQTQGTDNDSQEQANGDTQTSSDSENKAGENSEEASPSIINTPPKDAMESKEPNSHNHDDPTPHSDNNAPSGDMLYTGMMYYEQKEVGYRRIRYWYSVVRDLQVLKQYLKKRQASNVEHDNVTDLFKFIQPNGTLQLILKPPQRESGWTVDPDREPMELYQSRVDLFPSDPSYATCSLSVYAKPGTAQEPLHCSIELTGIDPSKIVYINASPPPPSSMIDSIGSNTASISQTRRETEEGTCRSDIAHRVMTECTGMIKDRLDLNTCSLVDKLLEKRIINEKQKNQLNDQHCGLTADQRMDKLLSLVKASIEVDSQVFHLFVEIIKQENTIITDRLAQTLLDNYKRLL